MRKIFLFTLVLALLTGMAAAEESRLSVSGSGTVYMEADQVSASLGVMLSGKDLGDVQNSVNSTVAGICAALQAAGLDEKSISTNHIYVSPMYNYASSMDVQELAGYSVNNTLSIITTDTEAIGSYIDAAFEAGANTFDSISFSVQDDSEAKDKALELAVQEARRKAEVIAAASGKTLGDIIEINEGCQSVSFGNGTAASYKMWADETAAMGVDTTVRAAQVSVSATIQIIFELK